ncbi:ATP-binding protein [Uliginosibacterium sp. H1]|uniref:ATP-binding protein n=1 Tax=Uliginosibacterium sp. H1 TaxID=3114757 RepID=UPI002E17B931|nr:ATP-binding protein [Uliginosibacterium sp. H1]
MNTPQRPRLMAPMLHSLAIAALWRMQGADPADAPEAQWLRAQHDACGDDLQGALMHWLQAAAPGDEKLHALGREIGLSPIETLTVAMAVAVETDAMVGRVLTWLQAPVGGARPTLGLVAAVAGVLGLEGSFGCLMDGPARSCGLLQFEGENRPLPEVSLLIPPPLILALKDAGGQWPGVRLAPVTPPAFPPSIREAASRQGHALQTGARILAVRSGHPREAQMAAALVASGLGARAAFIGNDVPSGLGPWLWLWNAVPVLCAELAPGEIRRLPEIPGYRGPVLVACGIDGSFERDGEPVLHWRVPLPGVEERVALWQSHTGDAALGEELGRSLRHGTLFVDTLGRAARYQARLEGSSTLQRRHVSIAARSGAAADLGTLAELMPEFIADDALVVPPNLRTELDALWQRCLVRENLASALGPAARTRYRPGVKALLVGPSGTGKTLAAGWLATRLGLPLYRVDLASMTSKYIGETEKNLAQLFARAEHAEIVLLFDEADSLFGKRTDVKESNDRFANAQTNYLLQRVESFEGIAILTSNSRGRFDSAFTRRLDAIIDFPPPRAEERRALWLAHLGNHHRLDAGELNRLAALCELAGGHIRNAVLYATALENGAPASYATLARGIATEYTKLGKQIPAGLLPAP